MTLALLLLAAPSLGPGAANDFVVPSGTTLVYDTTQGPLVVENLVVQADATLRVVGPLPFRVMAERSVSIDGTLDLSGYDAHDVATLNTAHQPEPGATGGPGGGSGGTSSYMTTTSTPRGGSGFGPFQAVRLGGQGGEAGYADPSLGANARRPGGGGGGALAAPCPLHPDPLNPVNRGRIALPGADGSPLATSGVRDTTLPFGGRAASSLFVDADRRNDFWGRMALPDGSLLFGELRRPIPGTGGGAGGDASASAVFPPNPWDPAIDEKGGPGGGGGGLAVLYARVIRLGPKGLVVADGGAGGLGENVQFLDHVGGSGGGGSGGFLSLQADLIDLRAASDRAIRALGGEGGDGFGPGRLGAGGHGGPGVIQLHTPHAGQDLLLPAGKRIEDLTAPTAYQLFPEAY